MEPKPSEFPEIRQADFFAGNAFFAGYTGKIAITVTKFGVQQILLTGVERKEEDWTELATFYQEEFGGEEELEKTASTRGNTSIRLTNLRKADGFILPYDLLFEVKGVAGMKENMLFSVHKWSVEPRPRLGQKNPAKLSQRLRGK
jgi:hypothetical protein